MITRFGAEAVYGRPLSLREMRSILLAENVLTAQRAYARAEMSEQGVAAWSRDNPEIARLLAWAMRLNGNHQD